MKRRTLAPLMSLVGLALAAVSQTGCNQTDIRMTMNPLSGKVAIYAAKGQKITWTSADGGFKVHFNLIAPCQEGNDVQACTINVNAGTYVYQCKECQDPVVVVGSAPHALYHEPNVAVSGPVVADVAMACVSSAIALQPDPVHASVGENVHWTAVGDPSQTGYLAHWTVTFPENSVCKDPVNEGQQMCQIKPGTSGDHAYTVTSSDCPHPGQGTLHVP